MNTQDFIEKLEDACADEDNIPISFYVKLQNTSIPVKEEFGSGGRFQQRPTVQRMEQHLTGKH